MTEKRSKRELVPWSPAELMSRDFEDLFRMPFLPAWRERAGWMPAIDMYEKDDMYVIKAELPGMKQDDLDITLSGNTLTIRGEKKTEEETEEKGYYRSERYYGSFARSVQVPSSVDTGKIEATYEDGVLQINLPKSEEMKAKKVEVKTGKTGATAGRTARGRGKSSSEEITPTESRAPRGRPKAEGSQKE